MANPHRGEIEAALGGRLRRLRLTLGALAELEHAFAADDLGDLARRFAGGGLKARDALRVIAAGLRGAGEPVTDAEVAAMGADGGAPAYADIVVRLLTATFGADAPQLTPREAGPETRPGEGAGVEPRPFPAPPASGPFPGTL